MSVREQQVNDALRVLDEMHRLCSIERDEYRRRRRQLLESLCDASGCNGSDTVRRALPAGVTLSAGTTVPRHAAGKAEVAAPRGRRVSSRLATVCVVVLGVVAGAAAVCWFLMTA
ncbi:hypothetical protein LMG28614_00087 [Paraburkholderia ultramafica]|uniref:Uncharacterized protein n=1 Tax=Paraburkholderia ultramafica TaxID=1544867 RepID=A0A6S7ART4_9BURK|nr:hypothetical protein [Paraburkholderia ultramafica]CAB3775800.1 hypothetical protein LMG28614_00087 [Paraburkholderia ultramafica]